MMREIDHSQAIILSGGGAYGAYEVGVMKALFSGESPATNYDFLSAGIFTGTSVGAFNASFIVSRRDEDICTSARQLEHFWLERVAESRGMCGNGVFRFRADPFRLLSPNCFVHPEQRFNELVDDATFIGRDSFQRMVNFLIGGGSVTGRTLELIDVSSLITGSPLTDLVKTAISMEHIRSSSRALRVVATNWNNGTVRVFENKDMSDEFGFEILRGSAAIPGFFHPHRVDGESYVDGGVLMNTPLKCAIVAGATTLHIIYMDPDIDKIPSRALQSTVDTLDRMMAITSAARVGEDIQTAIWINEGLEVIERVNRHETLSDRDAAAFIRVAAQVYEKLKQGSPYKKLTIHRYHPHDDLGGGKLGLLNFDRERIEALIARGFADGVNHDCSLSHCVIPK